MKVQTIRTGYLKLDGGAMFGVVPKSMWASLNPPDDENMCTWCMRVLLIQSGQRVILIDTGVGEKQDDRFRSFFHPAQQDLFLTELSLAGIQPEDVTDVLLTHLHFDHTGGAIVLDDDGHPRPLFPNATYWSSQRHWDWAMKPNAREKASFLTENFLPLQEWGMIQWADIGPMADWLPGIQLEAVYGHTEAMFVPVIHTDQRPIVYCADLIPSFHHIGLPYVMAYDVRPLDTIREKDRILTWALEHDAILVFEHDPLIEACTLTRDQRGRIVPQQNGRLTDLQ
ncbi:MAG: MBL fold metallo-hydrolase [Lewinellaceae bacterium]|nr:MBL fold metallo-hydrolase [Saprospiraceae bacterium]MCB9311341.1 MBL fold metallo-hydrolase [Lewinellaceae bacterium]